MSTKTIRKPHPDAIPTIYGWALPKTGEILVARRDLPNPVKGFKPNRPYKGEIEETVSSNVESQLSQTDDLPNPTTPEELNKLLNADSEKGSSRVKKSPRSRKTEKTAEAQ
jgi:hypothetical protein